MSGTDIASGATSFLVRYRPDEVVSPLSCYALALHCPVLVLVVSFRPPHVAQPTHSLCDVRIGTWICTWMRLAPLSPYALATRCPVLTERTLYEIDVPYWHTVCCTKLVGDARPEGARHSVLRCTDAVAMRCSVLTNWIDCYQCDVTFNFGLCDSDSFKGSSASLPESA
eukprot:3937887-Rhodomonas_salina.1